MAEPTLEELEKTNPNYFKKYDNPNVDAPPPRNPLAMRKYTPAGPSATSYNPNSYNPSQSRPQSGVVRTGPELNITRATGGGVTAGPVENWQRHPDGSITRNGVTVRPPRVSAAGDFASAARQPAQGTQPQVSAIAQVDRQAEQAAKAQEQKRQEAAKQANISVGEAFTEALQKWRDTTDWHYGKERVVEYDKNGRPLVPGVNGYEAKYQDSQNRYRIGALRPETIRALNQQRSALGLKTADSIVGIYATSGVDANGKPTGEPQIVTRYRDANGRIHSKAYTYQEAARFVRGTMGEKGDANADDRFAAMKQWQDADGNDALGITRTAEYQSRKSKLDAEKAKLSQTQAQVELAQAQTAAAKGNESRAQAKFENEQSAAATAKEMKPVADAEAKVKDLLDRADKVQKDSPEQAEAYRKQAADAQRQADRARAKIAFDRLPDGADIPNMPGAMKKDGKVVPKEGYRIKGNMFILKSDYMLDENGNAVKRPPKPAASKPSATSATPPAQPAKAPVPAAPTLESNAMLNTNEQSRRILRKVGRKVKGALYSLGEGYLPDNT